MTDSLISQNATDADTERPHGYHVSEQEALFFGCVIDALYEHGIKPPKGHRIPKDVRRVVDYDHVKLLMSQRMLSEEDNTPEGKDRHRNRLKTALRRNREALHNFKIIATSNPYIWHTGKHVRGFDHLLKGGRGSRRRAATTPTFDRLMADRAKAIEALADANAKGRTLPPREADAIAQAAYNRVCDLEDAIMALPPRSLADLAVMARIVASR